MQTLAGENDQVAAHLGTTRGVAAVRAPHADAQSFLEFKGAPRPVQLLGQGCHVAGEGVSQDEAPEILLLAADKINWITMLSPVYSVIPKCNLLKTSIERQFKVLNAGCTVNISMALDFGVMTYGQHRRLLLWRTTSGS